MTGLLSVWLRRKAEGRERGVRCGFPLARASEPRGFHALRQTLGDVSGR